MRGLLHIGCGPEASEPVPTVQIDRHGGWVSDMLVRSSITQLEDHLFSGPEGHQSWVSS